MNYLLLIASTISGVTKNLLSKSDKKSFSGLKNQCLVNIITSIVALAVFGASSRDLGMISDVRFLILALLYGLFTMLCQICYISAVEKGAVSICSMIFSCGFIIPTLYAPLVYADEHLDPLKIMGIVLLVASAVLVAGRTEKSRAGIWMLLAVAAMVCSGMIGILQKIFCAKYDVANTSEYLFVSFAFMLLISTVLFFAERRKEPATHSESAGGIPLKRILLPLAFGICAVFCNKANLYLTGVLPSVVFFPVYNGGVLASTTVSSCIIYRERLTKLQWLGVALGVASIIIIALN